MEGDTEDTPNTLQQVVVRRMMESKFSQPEFFVTSEIDMTEAVALRKSINAALPEGKGISFNDMIVRAAGLALQSHPRVNGSYTDGKFRVHHQYNVGVAVAMPDGGLVVPVVRDVPAKGLAALAAEAKDLIDRARNKKLALTEM
jgi:pyruvate dehydrogenase E2 component (dihydrolipoamide acetyltransferase)